MNNGKKTPRGARTHTGHTGAHGHTGTLAAWRRNPDPYKLKAKS